MASSASGPPRASLYRQYSRGSTAGGSIENLPPRTLARVSREVRDLIQNPPEGIRLVVDEDTGLPANLGEVVVSDIVLIDGDVCKNSSARNFAQQSVRHQEASTAAEWSMHFAIQIDY